MTFWRINSQQETPKSKRFTMFSRKQRIYSKTIISNSSRNYQRLKISIEKKINLTIMTIQFKKRKKKQA